MKKVHVLHSDNLEEVRQSLNLAMQLLDSKEINRVKLNTLIQLLEFSRIATLGKQALLADWTTIYLPVNSMKLKSHQTSTRQLISEFQAMKLKRPNPPTEEAIKRAQFVDKTYKWTGR